MFVCLFVCFVLLFFSRGLTTAVFRSGTSALQAMAREVLMMLVITGRRTSMFSYSTFVEIGSKSNDFGAVFCRISETNFTVTSLNVCRSLPE